MAYDNPQDFIFLLDKYTEIVEHRIRTNSYVIELMQLTPFFVLSEKQIYAILFEASALMITFADVYLSGKNVEVHSKIMYSLIDYFCSHYSAKGFQHDETISTEDFLYDRFEFYADTMHGVYMPYGHWLLNRDSSRMNDINTNLLILLGDYLYSAFFFETISCGKQLGDLCAANQLELIPFNAIIFEGIRPSLREYFDCLQ